MTGVAGDIGGTNARLALVDAGGAIVHRASYPSAEFPGLAPIVTRFLHEANVTTPPARACYGVACPIVEGTCRTPNLPWTLDARELARDTGIADTRLINDFTALALGVPHLAAEDVVVLHAGQPAPRGPIALLGAGTGLGEGFMVWSDGAYRVLASEGGHTLFTPRTAREWGLAEWLRTAYGWPTWERVLSGSGLVNIYRYVIAAGVAPETPAVKDAMAREDAAAVVTRFALAQNDAACETVLDLFTGAYGSLAGQLGLLVVATGGVFVGGGIAPRIIEKLKDGTFVAAFLDQDLPDVIAKIPVSVITNTDVGLMGAAAQVMRDA